MKKNSILVLLLLVIAAAIAGYFFIYKPSVKNKEIANKVEAVRVETESALLSFEGKIGAESKDSSVQQLEILKQTISSNYNEVKAFDYADMDDFKLVTDELFDLYTTIPDEYYLPIVNLKGDTAELSDDVQEQVLDLVTSYSSLVQEQTDLYNYELNIILDNEKN